MHKVKSFGEKILERMKNWSIRRKIIYGILFLVVVFVGYKAFGPKDYTADITSVLVQRGDLKETVLATGQVTSKTDLNLSFSKSGIVKNLKVKVGDKATPGQILANLDQGNELSALTSARGAVAQAEAKYQRILNGASSEEITLAKVALKNAELDLERIKTQQEILVANAYKTLLNSTPEALPAVTSSDFTPPTITGNYNKDMAGELRISISGGGTSFGVSGVANGGGMVTTTTPQPLGDSGLYIQFPNGSVNVSEWIISIPNKKASDYVTNLNAYQASKKTSESAIGTAEALVEQRKAELSIKQSSARPADVDLAKGELLSAEGQLQNAQANYEHTLLRAPALGTITKIDIKYGELTEVNKPVMVLEDIDNLYVEALINESNITSLRVDQPVSITFDAFGGAKKFMGKVSVIDPSADTKDGVVNYKIKVALDEANLNIRPGMNANIEVLAGEVKDVFLIPYIAVINRDNKSYVKIIKDKRRAIFLEKEVITGFKGDNNLIEIISGLSLDEEVLLKQK